MRNIPETVRRLSKQISENLTTIRPFTDRYQGFLSLSAYNTLGQKIYDSGINSPQELHVYLGSADRDSHGIDDQYTFWLLDIDDTYRYLSAPSGQRPLYYHVYEDPRYYYVQYWYFFNMNDISSQTANNSWHEGDFEHVSIKINKIFEPTLEPVSVNFYRHEGGRTIPASDCWWSSSNSLSYSGIQQGYDPSHTHLHIWIAANAHASYNRYDKVYRITTQSPVDPCPSLDNEDYKDNVDYDPTGYDLYFEYDFLDKLGEFSESPLQQASNGGYYPYAHNYYWFEHYEPTKSSKVWLTYAGRIGNYWGEGCLGIGYQNSPSPAMPVYGTDSHEWLTFTQATGTHGFGNLQEDKTFFGIEFVDVQITFVPDDPDGD